MAKKKRAARKPAAKKQKGGLFNFRRYKKEEGDKKLRHPKLIVGEDKNDYEYMGLTSKKSKGKHHNNIPLSTNPQKGNTRPAYLRKKISKDAKTKFSAVLDDYKLSAKDKAYVMEYVNKHKKR